MSALGNSTWLGKMKILATTDLLILNEQQNSYPEASGRNGLFVGLLRILLAIFLRGKPWLCGGGGGGVDIGGRSSGKGGGGGCKGL